MFRPLIALAVQFCALSVAQAQPCRGTAAGAFDDVRLARDTRIEIEQVSQRADRQLQVHDALSEAHGHPGGVHVGLDVDARVRGFSGLTLCAADGTQRAASIDRYDITVMLAAMIPQWQLSLRMFARSESLSVFTRLPRTPSEDGGPSTPGEASVKAQTQRSAFGGTAQFTDWFEVSGAWLTAERAGASDGTDDVPALPVTALATPRLLLGAGLPRINVVGDVLIDPATGDIADARVRLRDAPIWMSRLDVNLGWRAPQDEFYVSADVHRLFGVFGAGVDVVPGDLQLRSAWAGVGHQWRGGISSNSPMLYPEGMSPPDPEHGILIVWGYLDASLAATTYHNPTLLPDAGGAHQPGVDLRIEAGGGMPFFTFGLTLEVGVNRPRTLDALPAMAGLPELVMGVVGRMGL